VGWVWNVLLSCSNEEFWDDGSGDVSETCEPLRQINRWIPDGKLVSLVGPTYARGAGNGMGAYLFGGGFKHFDIEGFIKVVEAQNWKDRAKVQLWVKGAEEGVGEEPFTLVRLRRRSARLEKARRSPNQPKRRIAAKRKGS
jgi:hypothetical protein